MMNTDQSVTGPINTGNPNEFTIKQLADLVIGMVNSGSKVVYHDLPVDDPRQRKPDITLAREVLGWEPTIQLREGLAKTISYFQNLLADDAKQSLTGEVA